MSFFHYVTYKYIIIKDKRLGIAYYSLAVLILFYTTVQIFVNKAYLDFDNSPHGSIRLLVSTPPIKNAKQPEYCQQSNCRRVDGLTLNWPVESRAVTVATFIKELVQEKYCGDVVEHDMNSHTPYSVVREEHYYTIHAEEALVKVEHSISSTNSYSASHRMMTGSLVGVDGKVIKTLNSSNSSRVDKLYVKDFLQAANVILSDTSDALSAQGRTYRQNGVLLRVSIDYRNSDKWFGVGQTHYTFKVQHVPYSDYRLKQEVPIALPNGTICKRIVKKRYATRIEFDQAGKIGAYSLSALLMQLVSLVSLLTLTATIIDVIALYLVPDKTMYRQYVFDSSPELREKDSSKKKNE